MEMVPGLTMILLGEMATETAGVIDIFLTTITGCVGNLLTVGELIVLTVAADRYHKVSHQYLG